MESRLWTECLPGRIAVIALYTVMKNEMNFNCFIDLMLHNGMSGRTGVEDSTYVISSCGGGSAKRSITNCNLVE